MKCKRFRVIIHPEPPKISSRRQTDQTCSSVAVSTLQWSAASFLRSPIQGLQFILSYSPNTCRLLHSLFVTYKVFFFFLSFLPQTVNQNVATLSSPSAILLCFCRHQSIKFPHFALFGINSNVLGR